jgi:membrane-associated protein
VLGYLAGSAYSAVERRVGTGLAIAVAAVVVAAVAVWAVRRHRRAGPASGGPEGGEQISPLDNPDGPVGEQISPVGDPAGPAASGGSPPGPDDLRAGRPGD